jgi:hypothetical protein
MLHAERIPWCCGRGAESVADGITFTMNNMTPL